MRGIMIATLAAGLLASCSSFLATGGPAVLGSEDDVETVKAQLADVIGRGSIELGEPSPLEEPVLVVLPPPLGPLETRSPVMPKRYDIEMDRQGCRLIAADDGAVIDLLDVSCVRYKGKD